MARSIRNTVMLAKIETTAGTDAAPTASTNAVLLHAEDLSIAIEEQFAERDVLVGAFSSPDQLPYTRHATITFSVDAAGSGTAGTAPALGVLLKACGMAETVTASTRVTYNDISTAIPTLTLWGYMDGELRQMNYCVGTYTLNMSVGEVPKFTFTFNGLVTSISAASVPAATLTAWKRPQAVGPAFTTALNLGGTLAAGAVTGGTPYNFKTLTIDYGNDVQFDELVTQETVGVYGRATKITTVLDLGAAGNVAQWAAMHAGTTTTLSLTHGTVAGNLLLPFFGAVSVTGMNDNVDGNKLLTQVEFTARAVTVNDQVQLVFK